jgi:hypothetical protein
MSGLFRNTGRLTLRQPLGLLLLCLLAACNGVKVRPEQTLPHAAIQPANARAGLVLEQELREYSHAESRGGGDWTIELGPGHERLFTSVFSTSIANLQVFANLDAARAAPGLQALFVPHIEQYSFATAQETSGAYWAVTIRYRISVLSPQGDVVETLALTGYGSAPAARRSAESLTTATKAAMRDAAAKFLVQLPHQPLTQKLVAGQNLSAADASSVAVEVVELVPVVPVEQGG